MPQTITFPTTSPVSVIPGDVVTVSTATGSFLVHISCDKPSSILFQDADAGVLAHGDIANGDFIVTLPKANSNMVVDSYTSATITLAAVAVPDSGIKDVPILGPTGVLGAFSPGSLYQVNIQSKSPYTCILYSMPNPGDEPLGTFPVVHGDVISLPAPKVTGRLVSADADATVCLQLVITNPKAVS